MNALKSLLTTTTALTTLLLFAVSDDMAVAAESSSPNRAGSPGPAAAGFHLRGVLISNSSRSALVNGSILREGDQIGNAEILAITEDAVRIRTGSRELRVPVGARAMAGGLSSPNFVITRNRSSSASGEALSAKRVDPEPANGGMAPEAPADSGQRRHVVERGETLGGIARHYLGDGQALEQAMLSIYAANPAAFNGNVNVLFDGAVLTIPTSLTQWGDSVADARAEIRRHTERWRSVKPVDNRQAAALPATQYGPVRAGETLSGVAAKVRHDGVTADQMMVALFDTNPHAFNGNINRLRQDAVLAIPSFPDVMRQSPDLAAAEVQRQILAWRSEPFSVASAERTTAALQRGLPGVVAVAPLHRFARRRR